MELSVLPGLTHQSCSTTRINHGWLVIGSDSYFGVSGQGPDARQLATVGAHAPMVATDEGGRRMGGGKCPERSGPWPPKRLTRLIANTSSQSGNSLPRTLTRNSGVRTSLCALCRIAIAR